MLSPIDSLGLMLPVVAVFASPGVVSAQTILREWRGEQFGSRVAGLGDVDGDGVPDVAVGAPFASLQGTFSGQVVVFSGGSGAQLFSVSGSRAFDLVGRAIAGPGDVDGDGRADVAIGGLEGQWDLRLYSGRTGALFTTFPLRWLVAGPGDVNQDGNADLFVGYPEAFIPPLGGTGAAELVSLRARGELPRRGNLRGDYTPLRDLSVTELFGFQGSYAWQGLGLVARGGDLDADGVPDLLLGAAGVWPNSGAGGAFAYSGDTGEELFYLAPPPGSDSFPSHLAGLGDVNADGFDDVAVSDRGPRLLEPYFHVTVFAGPTGNKLFTLQSPTQIPNIGDTVAAPGDVDGDGHADIVAAGLFNTGHVILYSGRDQSVLFLIEGSASVFLGSWTADLGDLDGDDFPDYLVGGTDRTANLGFARVYSGAPDGVTAFGLGCPDGRNIIPRIGASHTPALGESDFAINLSRVRTGTNALLALGTSNQTWNGSPLPFDLSAFGLPGCLLLVSPDALLAMQAQGTIPEKGWVSFVVPIPNDPGLRGSNLFAQWLVVDSFGASNPGDRSASVTRGLRITVQ